MVGRAAAAMTAVEAAANVGRLALSGGSVGPAVESAVRVARLARAGGRVGSLGPGAAEPAVRTEGAAGSGLFALGDLERTGEIAAALAVVLAAVGTGSNSVALRGPGGAAESCLCAGLARSEDGTPDTRSGSACAGPAAGSFGIAAGLVVAAAAAAVVGGSGVLGCCGLPRLGCDNSPPCSL